MHTLYSRAVRLAVAAAVAATAAVSMTAVTAPDAEAFEAVRCLSEGKVVHSTNRDYGLFMKSEHWQDGYDSYDGWGRPFEDQVHYDHRMYAWGDSHTNYHTERVWC